MISGSVLVLTFWPVVRDDTKVAAVATVATIVVLHTLLAIGCKVSERAGDRVSERSLVLGRPVDPSLLLSDVLLPDSRLHSSSPHCKHVAPRDGAPPLDAPLTSGKEDATERRIVFKLWTRF